MLFFKSFAFTTFFEPSSFFQLENVDTLMVMAEWLDVYGETIYGTRKGPIEPQKWGVTTSKNNLVYLHLLEWDGGILTIPRLDKELQTVLLYHSDTIINFHVLDDYIQLHIPADLYKPLKTILVLKFESS